MEKISYNLNVSFAVQQLNGFVGETLIFVSHVIKGSVKEIMSASMQRISYLYARVQESAQSVVIIMGMDSKNL